MAFRLGVSGDLGSDPEAKATAAASLSVGESGVFGCDDGDVERGDKEENSFTRAVMVGILDASPTNFEGEFPSSSVD
ncbi:hypothetical protein R1flu_011625 [Riccia fluitans]|uniref:Uncharacterized protein n=1 Tax=Riccia fluitans TaxID=41844 RepID=A0ABD1Z8B7_9MARC